MSASLERARLLFAHERYDQAERELRGCLAADPQHVGAHYLLALCLCEQERYDEAMAEAKTAISLAPDEPLPHYGLAKVLYARDLYDNASLAIDEAIRLDPNDADFRSLSAAIHHDGGRLQHAMEETEIGLQIDPGHTGCLNIRALAQVKLGRKSDARASLAVSLQKNPENAFTHATQGWTLLHQRRPQQAMEHFVEALRLDPNMDRARWGLLEAIKGHNIAYRWIIAGLLSLGRLTFGCLIVFVFVLFQAALIASMMAAKNPSFGPYIWPFVGFLAILFAMAWLTTPLCNLALCSHPIGKHALSRDQIAGAKSVGACFALGLPLLLLGLVAQWTWVGIAGFTFTAISLPVAVIYECERGNPRTTMAGITFALLVVGLAAAGLSIRSQELGLKIAGLFLLGVLGSGSVKYSVNSQNRRK